MYILLIKAKEIGGLWVVKKILVFRKIPGQQSDYGATVIPKAGAVMVCSFGIEADVHDSKLIVSGIPYCLLPIAYCLLHIAYSLIFAA